MGKLFPESWENGRGPLGSMPRSIDVIVRDDDNVEKARAGDRMVFTGSLIVIGKRCLL